MNLQAALFYAMAALTLTGAMGVVLSQNIVRAAVQLLMALVGIGGLYFLLHAEFLAAVQLVIYVGGTLVLIIFGVMLTSRVSTKLLFPTRMESLIAGLAAIAMAAVLVLAILATKFAEVPLPPPADETRALGVALLGKFLLPFEMASLLLLAVMIGAAYLAKKREPADGDNKRGST